ncbi:MAG: chemotaxis protein MotB [Proteobacteria bacterium]|jgi:chemotaxis protein MotB|nr:flagellar motor protein MotB [Alphaproteobacteria bacterium]NCC04095.1 chemotaxis protein MotB [Pseudomonadota bacterium]
MADHNQPVIIIKKKKKGGHAGHHGGAWKVAYADFVTAMMSFFLLLWLLNVTTSDQRKGIADYFAPMAISHSEGGAGGPMGGLSITAKRGAELSSTSPMGLEERMVATVGEGDEGEEDVRGKSELSAEGQTGTADNPAKDNFEVMVSKDAAALAHSMKQEEEKFKAAESMLRDTLLQSPALKGLADNLIIDRTPEGLRIQIIDKDQFSLFPSGSSNPYDNGRKLLQMVGAVIEKLPNQIAVSGHTDSAPFPVGSRRDNWDLSTDRANVSRTELNLGGVPKERIARVSGLADKDPFVKNDPKDSRNRRISIVLLRQIPSAPAKTMAKDPSVPAQP